MTLIEKTVLLGPNIYKEIPLLNTNTWTAENYKPLKEAITRITEGSDLSEELLHYVLSQLLERKDVQHLVETGEAWYMCLKIATNSWRSTTSPFYLCYRKEKIDLSQKEYALCDDTEDQNLDIDGLLTGIDKELNQLSWYEKELMKAYAEHNNNASALAKGTGIPRTSISLTIKRIRNHVKERIKPEDYLLPVRGSE
jgi:hypothetical protein